MSDGQYSERLHVPPLWWVIGLAFGLTGVVAVGGYLGQFAGLVTAVVVVVLVVWVLIAYGGATIRVDSAGLTAGSARLEWPYVGEVKALGAERTRARLRWEGSANAFLLIRPYVRTAIEVTVADQADPHPYWLLSTRDPERLAAAIQAARSAAPDNGSARNS